MLLVIDNFDSFTYNLVQYCAELGTEVIVRRNDTPLASLQSLQPSAIIVSPGPCTPTEAGISVEAIRFFAGRIPILGVCLGHQSLAVAFGGQVVQAEQPMHGKTSMVLHTEDALFSGVPSPFQATRYHSLLVDAATLPADFEVTASVDKLIMGMRHRPTGAIGVQFHPESILTRDGKQMLQNFLQSA